MASRSAFPFPELQQRPLGPEYRVLARPGDFPDGPDAAVVLLDRRPAFVVGAGRRIRSYRHESFARRQTLMPGAGGKDHGVAGFELERAPPFPAETDLCAAPGNAQDLVDTRVIVQVVVDSTTPAIAPPVTFEKVFPYGRRGRASRAA